MEREQLPLTAEGFHRFNQAAHEQEDIEYKLTGLALLHTGLRNQEWGHMSKRWIEETSDGMQIRIPKQVKCWKDGGCKECTGEDNGAPDGYWSPKTDHGSRVVPVPPAFENHHTGEREETDLQHILRSYFDLHDRAGMGGHKVLRIVKQIAMDADIHELQGRGLTESYITGRRELLPDIYVHDLRGSWACQCIRSDINRFRIRDFGGWADVAMLNKYARFVGDGTGEAMAKY